MIRFTTKNENGNVLELRYGSVPPWAISEGDGFNYPRYTISGSAVDQLAAYEETGLSPEDIVEMKKREKVFYDVAKRFTNLGEYDQLLELIQLERDNRLVKLPPCKAGDDVWIIYEDEIHKIRVQGMSLTISNKVLLHFGGYPITCIYALEQGKKWFLSREDAEIVLKERL